LDRLSGVTGQAFTRGRTDLFSSISSYDLELSPMTLTYKLDLDWVELNCRA